MLHTIFRNAKDYREYAMAIKEDGKCHARATLGREYQALAFSL